MKSFCLEGEQANFLRKTVQTGQHCVDLLALLDVDVETVFIEPVSRIVMVVEALKRLYTASAESGQHHERYSGVALV